MSHSSRARHPIKRKEKSKQWTSLVLTQERSQLYSALCQLLLRSRANELKNSNQRTPCQFRVTGACIYGMLCILETHAPHQLSMACAPITCGFKNTCRQGRILSQLVSDNLFLQKNNTHTWSQQCHYNVVVPVLKLDLPGLSPNPHPAMAFPG